MRDVLRNAIRVLDLRRPLDDTAEHGPIVDFLEGLSITEVGSDLTDEEDHRGRILNCGVDADAGIRGPRAAGDHRDARPAGELAVGLGHVRRAAFMAADHEPDPIANIVHCVQHGKEALARDAEDVRYPLGEKIRDQDFAAGARGGGRLHGARFYLSHGVRPHRKQPSLRSI